MKIPNHGSVSFFNKLNACPLDWAFHYLLSRGQSRSAFQYLGLNVHEIIHLVDTGQVDPKQMHEKFTELWNTQQVFAPNTWDFAAYDWGVKNPEGQLKAFADYHDTGQRLVQIYYSGPHRNNKPARFKGEWLSEMEVHLDLSKYGAKYLKTLDGRIDRVTEKGTVVDFKTKMRNKITINEFRADIQGPIYVTILEDMGVIQPPVTFRYGQLIHGNYGGEEYDQTIGGRIDKWRTDRMRQLVIPGLIEKAEEWIDRALNTTGYDSQVGQRNDVPMESPGSFIQIAARAAEGPILDLFERRAQPNKNCTYCDHRPECPVHNQYYRGRGKTFGVAPTTEPG